MDKPTKTNSKPPVTTASATPTSTTPHGVENKKSPFPYAATALTKSNQIFEEFSVLERHCIVTPNIFTDILFKGYDLKTILTFRLISKTVCEFINLRNFLGMQTSISFWYTPICIPPSESISQNQQNPTLEPKSLTAAKLVLQLLSSALYDKALIDKIQTIDLSKYVFSTNNTNIALLNQILSLISQNLPTSLEKISIGILATITGKSSFTFTPPKELLKKITTFSIKDNHDVTVDLEEATGLQCLDIGGVRGNYLLPKVMNKLKTICLNEVTRNLTLPTQANCLVNLHIKEVRKATIFLPRSLDKLENLCLENLIGTDIHKLPKSFPNLISLSFIGSISNIDLSGSFPKLTTLTISYIRTRYTESLLFPQPIGDNLKLSDSYPSLTNLSINCIAHKTHFKLPRVDALKTLSIGSVDMSGSFQTTSDLNNLEVLIINQVNDSNIKLPVMPSLKKFILEDMYRYARFEFPGTFDTLKALDTNVFDNKKFELEDSGKNTIYIRSKNR